MRGHLIGMRKCSQGFASRVLKHHVRSTQTLFLLLNYTRQTTSIDSVLVFEPVTGNAARKTCSSQPPQGFIVLMELM